MRVTRPEALPKKGKPDSSLFPAGFQPPETKPFQWLASQTPTPAISPFHPKQPARQVQVPPPV
jgi:hypothetical protein